MLILSRKPKESIRISEDIVVTVLKVRGNIVQLGIEAPLEIPIRRTELLEKIRSCEYQGAPIAVATQ